MKVEKSLTPRDVGFDLRTTKIPVKVEPKTAYRFLDNEQNEQVVSGDMEKIMKALKTAGYKIAQ